MKRLRSKTNSLTLGMNLVNYIAHKKSIFDVLHLEGVRLVVIVESTMTSFFTTILCFVHLVFKSEMISSCPYNALSLDIVQTRLIIIVYHVF